MGKRSDCKKVLYSDPTPMLKEMGEERRCLVDSLDGRDFLPTPQEAVFPLLPHLNPGTLFEEPCAGDGALVDALEKFGHHCTYSCDIKPRRLDILEFDAFDINRTCADLFISNPPWNRKILHPLITHLISIAPTWLLFDADWKHTKQATPYLPFCVKIISVGRIKWIPDSPGPGKDNCCWYLFNKGNTAQTKFYGRGD